MCDHCITLRLAITKGQRLAESGVDPQTRSSALVFVETLMAELIALELEPGHKEERAASEAKKIP